MELRIQLKWKWNWIELAIGRLISKERNNYFSISVNESRGNAFIRSHDKMINVSSLLCTHWPNDWKTLPKPWERSLNDFFPIRIFLFIMSRTTNKTNAVSNELTQTNSSGSFTLRIEFTAVYSMSFYVRYN